MLTQIFGWSYMLGTIALSLMFLAGYGGMVSLAQMTIAGFAGYMVAILGVNGMPGGIGWPWWLAVPAALILAMIVGAIIGALAVRTAGIYTIMITLAIAAAFFYFANRITRSSMATRASTAFRRPCFSGSIGTTPYPLTIFSSASRSCAGLRSRISRGRPSGLRFRAFATIPGAWRRSASTSTPTASRPMSSRR